MTSEALARGGVRQMHLDEGESHSDEPVAEGDAGVREGSGIKKSLDQSKLFPPMTLQLIASGENSGNLEEMLDRAATQLEREQVTLIAYIVGIFEPAIILTMGVLVLMIVLGILLPIFDLNQLVK